MEAEFANGYDLSIGHFPGRKKPIIRLGKNGSYVAHAVFNDEESAESFTEFFMELWRK